MDLELKEIMRFGRHKGKTVLFILENDPQYIYGWVRPTICKQNIDLKPLEELTHTDRVLLNLSDLLTRWNRNTKILSPKT